MKTKIILGFVPVVVILLLNVLYAEKANNKKNDSLNYELQAGGSDWIAPAYAAKLKNPLKDKTVAIKEGKSLFTANCVSCHGDKGEGNGPAAAALYPKPKNLTSAKVQEQPDGALFWKITTGKQPMVSWKSTLSEKERWSLVDYIRTLKNNK